MLEHLINGVFYTFLISQCDRIRIYICNPEALDWIPFQVRKRLVLLLDAWKAVVMRLERLRNPPEINGTPLTIPDYIMKRFFEEEEKRWRIFHSIFMEVYLDAVKLQRFSEQRGQKAPEPDLEFWHQEYERETYIARFALGEPVVLYGDRCYLEGRGDNLIPGPYPGLRYYEVDENALTPEEKFFEDVARKEKANIARMWYTPRPINTTRFAGYPNLEEQRRGLLKHFNIIGPATYAEFEYQHGFSDTVCKARDYAAPST